MITLNTILYNGNYVEFLKPETWFFTYESKIITERLITINNLSNINDFYYRLDALQLEVKPRVIFVNDIIEEIESVFKVDINQNVVGYNYTIPYFAALLKAKSTFLLNVATDCMNDISINDDFLLKATSELYFNKNCSSAMVSWVKDNHLINNMSVGEYEESEMIRQTNVIPLLSEDFNLRKNFTDQFFLVSIEKLKDLDYNLDERIAEQFYRGPEYGGNSFEKRIVGNNVKNNMYSYVYKGPQYYIHDKNYY